MEYIRAHKWALVAFIVLVLLLIVLIQVRSFFTDKDNGAAYGDRLASVKKVKVSDKLLKDITKKLNDNEAIKKASVRKQGRIVRSVITVEDSIPAPDSKGLANIVLESLSEKQVKNYDIEVLIRKDAEDATFPIIGYKQRSKEGFSWTKDR